MSASGKLRRGIVGIAQGLLRAVLVDEADLDKGRGSSFGRTSGGYRHSAGSRLCKIAEFHCFVSYVLSIKTVLPEDGC